MAQVKPDVYASIGTIWSLCFSKSVEILCETNCIQEGTLMCVFYISENKYVIALLTDDSG